ncbi:hypothetical protein [Nannocystis pusilla]
MAWKNDDADPVMTLQGVFTEAVPHERAPREMTSCDAGSSSAIATRPVSR